MNQTNKIGTIALFLGFALGFGGAVVAGYQAAGYSKPSHFKRFHFSISLETRFYPTFAMLENLALARWHPGQTVVVIGGNSIFNGVGQPENDLWSDHLQSELGDRYVVVNLAFRGASCSEAAALVAESLLRRGVPSIYVADCGPGNTGRAYGSTYEYLFWDARYKDRLLPFPERDASFQTWISQRRPAVRLRSQELQLGARLDSWFRFQSLWHHVGYRHFFTVWDSILRDGWWRPRDQFTDPEPGAPPVAERFREPPERELQLVRDLSEDKAQLSDNGSWQIGAGGLESLYDEIGLVFPPALRPRMLLVMTQSCPQYRNVLTPAERQRDESVCAAYRDIWIKRGVACVGAGGDWTNEDFADRCHIAAAGGRKLAHLVAAEVQAINQSHP